MTVASAVGPFSFKFLWIAGPSFKPLPLDPKPWVDVSMPVNVVTIS